uniref:2-dehydro-3-deoxygalactonokinase n=1 Tax=Cereibacter sphaeroides TaxID=1063 RepID=UPI001E638FCC|nr:2-dehydro-3-deoxygalactonokinase [Cereibacter sphaeroides]
MRRVDGERRDDPPRAILVDWGTSRMRAWIWRGGRDLSPMHSDDRGMKTLTQADYPAVLSQATASLGAPAGTPVLICGMAGARGGWLETGYLAAPTDLGDLHRHARRVGLPDRDVRILPGVSCSGTAPDVMRGEETQLAGLLDDPAPGLTCLPGTHSKWALRDGSVLSGFTTFMTGELFEVIGRHSILARTLGEGWDDAAFLEAAEEALSAPELVWRAFFGLRASALLEEGRPASARARLSGLLIGAECAAARRLYGAGPVTLVASGAMERAYGRALAAAGFAVTLRDGEEITCRGLIRAAEQIWRD